MHYFAYGSNMNPARMTREGVRWTTRSAARLDGWRIAFRKRAGDSPVHAYATIEPAPGACVEGVLYLLAAVDDIARLDAFEEVPNRYRRQTVRVRTGTAVDAPAGAEAILAEVYVAQPAACADGLLPESWYIAHMLAASDLLSPEYVAFLRALPVAHTPPRW